MFSCIANAVNCVCRIGNRGFQRQRTAVIGIFLAVMHRNGDLAHCCMRAVIGIVLDAREMRNDHLLCRRKVLFADETADLGKIFMRIGTVSAIGRTA